MKIGIFGTGIVRQTLAGALGSPMFNFTIVR